MNSRPGSPTPLRTSTAPDPLVPVLLTGPRAAVLLDGTGDVKLQRESRGALQEWGGVYAEGIRLTGPWSVRFDFPAGSGDLATSLTSMEVHRWGAVSEHQIGELRIRQELSPLDVPGGPPAVGRRLLLTAGASAPAQVGRVTVRVEPFLAPVILEGIQPYEYRLTTRGSDVVIESHGSGLGYHSDPLPSRLQADGVPWIGGRRSGELRCLQLEYDVPLPAGGSVCLDWVISGGLGRVVPVDEAGRTACVRAVAGGLAAGRVREETWIASTPEMYLPGLPLVESGYRLARGALHQLYQTATPDMAGLVAGYPWYAALWGRDLGWMLPAVLWMGDVDRVAVALRSLFRYQAHARLPILGAAAGELPMQVTSGPIFLFGTSDTTLYPAGVLRRVLHHTGNPTLVEELVPGLARAGAWADAKVDPSTGLFRHGGEVATMKAAVEGAGKIHYGFDAIDTTIWDSTDRRDHALDVQVLYLEMLRVRAEFARRGGDDVDATRLTERAEAIAKTIASRYRWADEGYLFDSLRIDGTAVAKVRPNALRAVSAGLLTPDAGRAAVARASRDDLATPWGLRTLSARDPGYAPTAYHDGQVWTIATAWAADAALTVGEVELGLSYLECVAGRLEAEGGLANECYRGDRPEPYDSCFLLGFSVAPFLTTLFDKLWGLDPQFAEDTLRVEPRIPDRAGAARLEGLSLGRGRVDLRWEGGELTVRWNGPSTLHVVRGTAEALLASGESATLSGGPPKPL